MNELNIDDDLSTLSPKTARRIQTSRQYYAGRENRQTKNVLRYEESVLRELEQARLQKLTAKHVQQWLMLGNRAKTVGVVPLTYVEQQIVMLVFTEARAQRRYKSPGQLTTAQWLSVRLNIHRNQIGKALAGLEKREFIERVMHSNTEWLVLQDDLYRKSFRVEWRWRFMQNAGAAWPDVVNYGIEEAMDMAFEIADDTRRDMGDARQMNKVFDQVLMAIGDCPVVDLDTYKSSRKPRRQPRR